MTFVARKEIHLKSIKTRGFSLTISSHGDLDKTIEGQLVLLKDRVFSLQFSWPKRCLKKGKPPTTHPVLSKTEVPNSELHVSQAASATEITTETCTASVAVSSPGEKKDTDSWRDQREKVKKNPQDLRLENAEIEVLKCHRDLIDSSTFQLRNFPSGEDLAFYTGFPNLATFNAIFEFLNAGLNRKNIRYYVN